MNKKKALFYIPAFVCAGILAEQEINFTVRETSTNHQTTTAHIFAHGLGATQQQGINIFSRVVGKSSKGSIITNQRWLIDEPLVLFDFPDAKGNNNEYHRKQVTLGQEKDINQLAQAYQKTCELFPQHNIVLSGVSRGAATIINFIAQHETYQVKALILESPFDKLSSIVKHLLARFRIHWFPFSKQIAYKVCRRHFPNVNINGIFPINVIQGIPSTIPVMLIHSKTDKVIPINSSRRLYIKLKEAGHQNVYLVELSSGSHGKLLLGTDADFYHYVVHALYKKYGLAYHPEFAHHGDNLLSICQPSIEEVKKRFKRKRKPKEPSIDIDDDFDDEELEDDLIITQ